MTDDHFFSLDKPHVKALLENDGDHHNGAWYLDSGAINHMTRHRNIFVELDTSITSNVKFGDCCQRLVPDNVSVN